MSFYAIRYEYADESNSSRQSAAADPPLFKQEEEPFQNFVETCDDPAMHFQSPIPFENSELATSNASSHGQVQMFNPFDHHNYALNSYWQPKHDDQNTSSDQGRRWQHSERRHSLQSNSIYQQEIDNPYYSSDPSSQRNSFLFTEEDRENIAPGSSQFARKKHFENESSSESFDKDIQANRRVKMEPSPTYGNAEENADFEYPYEADENDENLFGSKGIGKQDWPNSLNLEERNNVVIVRGSKELDENVDFDEFVENSTMSGSKTENTKEQQIAANGFGKPAYSYSCLIGLSLKNSPTGELTVSEIYTFLCYHFPYFREAPSGWKNSVRHNLSLNKCFKKIEIETPGSHGRKSCLWTMNPARMVKMDQELNKWRERDEIRILNAMENPANLDALQNGTMGMPPNMKPRRFSVIKNDKPSLVVRASQNPRPLSSSFHASSTIQRDHPYTIQRGIHFHQNNRHQPIHNRQQHPKKIFQHQSNNESVHTQAARKLENLLKRQKTSTPLPFADGLPFYDGTGVNGNNRKRSSTESCSSSSEHSSRRLTHQHSNVENQQKLFIGSKSVADRPAMTSKHCQFVNQPAKLSRADREEQENAADFLYQQLYKNSSSNKEIANNDGIRNVKGKHQFPQTEPQCSHLLPHNELAIHIDQTLSNAPMVGFLQSSPFAVTSASLGLESCENALTQNPLLDPTLQ